MARNESDREDLMAEAVSLSPRIELQYPANGGPTVVGINQLGWLFVYLGQETMYRFDEHGRLRRAFVSGTLYRTSGQTLSALIRQRNGIPGSDDDRAESLLLRRDLSKDELIAFRDRMRSLLSTLADGFDTLTVLRQHPTESVGLSRQFQDRLFQVLRADEFLAPAIVRR